MESSKYDCSIFYTKSDLIFGGSCSTEVTSELLFENAEPAKDDDIALTNNVFIVHGHCESKILEVESFLKDIGYNPIVLKEQPNKGNTIIEKIEENVDECSFGIVLYTSCDIGYLKDKEEDKKPRARQNVVFEHGYLCGKLGRGRVVALVENGVETPGDIDGIVYIPMNDPMWKFVIAKEMKAAGLDVDLNKVPLN